MSLENYISSSYYNLQLADEYFMLILLNFSTRKKRKNDEKLSLAIDENWWNWTNVMTHRMLICWFMSLHEPFSCNSFHSRWWYGIDEMLLLRWSVSEMTIFYEIFFVWVKTNLMMTSEILENNWKFMELVFHWVTKTIKIASWKIICTRQENFAIVSHVYGSIWAEICAWGYNSGSSSRRSNNDKILRAAMRLKEIVLMFNWWFYDAKEKKSESAGDE